MLSAEPLEPRAPWVKTDALLEHPKCRGANTLRTESTKAEDDHARMAIETSTENPTSSVLGATRLPKLLSVLSLRVTGKVRSAHRG